MDSERTRMAAHRLGAAGNEVDTAKRSRTYTARSAIPRATLSGISQKSSADTMEGNTTRNQTSDDAGVQGKSVEVPIHIAQISNPGRGLLRPGIGAASLLPDPRVIDPTPESSRKAHARPQAPRAQDQGAGRKHHFLIIGVSKWRLKLASPERPLGRLTSSRRGRRVRCSPNSGRTAPTATGPSGSVPASGSGSDSRRPAGDHGHRCCRRPDPQGLVGPGPNPGGSDALWVQYSPLITKYEPRMVPASFDFWRANLNEPNSAGTSIPSESLNPTARFGFGPSSVYRTLIDSPLS